jgi:hypothetical protein
VEVELEQEVQTGLNGGSGGGGNAGRVHTKTGRECAPAANAGGSGNTPPVSPPQGFADGNAYQPDYSARTMEWVAVVEHTAMLVDLQAMDKALGQEIGGAGATSEVLMELQ